MFFSPQSKSNRMIIVLAISILFGDVIGRGGIVSAFRSGSPSCDAGTNVGTLSSGFHGRQGSGGLADGDYVVTLGDTELQDGTNKFEAGSTLELTLSGPPFRGFMIRLSSEDGSDNTGELIIFDSENSKNLDLCDFYGVSGVTHPNRKQKTSITIGFEALGSRLLEVMVVQKNRPLGSNHWFGSAFSLTAAATSTTMPSDMPSLVPSSQPSSVPTI